MKGLKRIIICGLITLSVLFTGCGLQEINVVEEEPVSSNIITEVKKVDVELVEPSLIEEPIVEEPVEEEHPLPSRNHSGGGSSSLPVFIPEPIKEEPVIEEPILEEPQIKEEVDETTNQPTNLLMETEESRQETSEPTEETIKEEIETESKEEIVVEETLKEETLTEENAVEEIVEEEVEEELSELDQFKLDMANQAINIAKYLTKDIDTDLEEYLALTPYSSIDTYKQIKELVADITKDCETEEEKARLLYDWVRQNMKQDRVGIAYNCDEAFKNLKGLCSQYTQLLHDMYCAAGIKSFYISGIRGGLQHGKLAYNEEFANDPEKNYGTYTIYTDYTLEEAVNIQAETSSSNHAFLLAEVNNEWKFYDAMCDYSKDNYVWFGMSSKELVEADRVPYYLNGIRCYPEDLDLDLVETCEGGGFKVYREGEIFVWNRTQQAKKYTFSDYLQVNGALRFQVVNDPNKPHYLFDNTNTVGFASACIKDLNKYYNRTLVQIKTNGIATTIYFYTSDGLQISLEKGLEYMLLQYSEEEINTLLTGTTLSIIDNIVYYSNTTGSIDILQLN